MTGLKAEAREDFPRIVLEDHLPLRITLSTKVYEQVQRSFAKPAPLDVDTIRQVLENMAPSTWGKRFKKNLST